MSKKVELQPGIAVEEIYDSIGHPRGLKFVVAGPGLEVEFTMQPDGVIKLAEYLEHLVA